MKKVMFVLFILVLLFGCTESANIESVKSGLNNLCDSRNLVELQAEDGEAMHLFENKWISVFHSRENKFGFNYFDTYDNSQYINVNVNECTANEKLGVAFEVTSFNNQTIDFTVKYDPERVRSPTFKINEYAIFIEQGEKDIIGINNQSTTLEGKFYSTDHITLVCLHPCPEELDENIKHFLNMQMHVLEDFEGQFRFSLNSVNKGVRPIVYILEASNQIHEGITYSKGWVNFDIHQNGAYYMERLPGFYPPGSSYQTDQDNIWADLHETKHIIQNIILGRTGKYTNQYAEGDAIATEEFFDIIVPINNEDRTSRATEHWNCLKNGGTAESCNLPTNNMAQNRDVNCDEMVPVTGHALGATFYAAMNEEYGCDFECMSRIFVKAGQLTQPEGNQVFEWREVLPTNLDLLLEYRNDPAQFGTMLKQIADEEVRQDTSYIFDRLCFPRND